MNKRHSQHLDFIRFSAAIMVFIEHLSSPPFTVNVIPDFLTDFGSIGVSVFFVLSGYVIAYVVEDRESRAAVYTIARISRLYSVILLALGITFILDSIGITLKPDYYAIPKVLLKSPSVEGYVSSFFFVNEWRIFGFYGIAPGTNNPLWSLSFEATYYVIMGFVLFAPRILSIPMTLVIFFLSGKTFVVMFPVWLLGFVLYRIRKLLKIPRFFAGPLMLVGIFVVLSLPFVTLHLPQDNFGLFFPWGRFQINRNLIEDYLTALFTAITLLSSSFLTDNHWSTYDLTKKISKALGDYTFPLYAFHYPLICFLSAISPWPHTGLGNLAFVSILTVGIIILLVPITTWLKITIRNYLNKVAHIEGVQPALHRKG